MSGWVAGAIVVAGVGSAMVQANAAKQAAKSQLSAANQANATGDAQFDRTREDMAPWRNAGGSAINRLSFLLGLPGYGPKAPGSPTGSLRTLGTRPGTTTPAGTAPATGILGKLGIEGREPKPMPGAELAAKFGGSEPAPELAAAVQQKSMDDPFTPNGGGGVLPNELPIYPANGGADPNEFSGDYGQLGEFGSLDRDFSMADYQADPGYEFRLKEGQKALERSAAAGGRFLGGGTLKALTRYGQDMGSQEYGNAYNRYQTNRSTRFNQLAAIAGIGQTSTGQLAQLGAINATNSGNNLMGAANAQSAAGIASGNAWGSALNNGVNNWLTYKGYKS